jgi:hypothetical protein
VWHDRALRVTDPISFVLIHPHSNGIEKTAKTANAIPVFAASMRPWVPRCAILLGVAFDASFGRHRDSTFALVQSAGAGLLVSDCARSLGVYFGVL